MGAAVAVSASLSTTVCCECGIYFAVPPAWEAERRRDGKGFKCPNGHSLTFGESENDRLRKEVAEKDRRIALEQNMRRSAEEQRDKAIKSKKRTECRVHAGVCPHCNRTFKQLAAHMKTKHPETK